MRRLLFVALFAVSAHAHDFWIEPSTFRPKAGTTFTTALRVGENFEGDPVPRRSPRIESFVVRDASGERSVNGFENQDPAGFVQLDGAGPAVVMYRSKANPHELPRKKFEAFLHEEGITGLTVRDGVQRERFFRFAKTIVGGAPESATVAAPFGDRFELVPVKGGFRLLFEQKPLPNVLVVAVSREGKKLSARTNANGVATIATTPGVWLVKSVHVIPAPQGSGFQWDSLWASLTFER